MMKIPILESPDVPYPEIPIRVSMETALGEQLGAMGAIQGLVNQVTTDIGRFNEKKRVMKQTTEIAQAEIDVQNANQEAVKNLKLNPNPDTYYPNWQKSFEKISQERLSKITDPETRAKAQISLKRMQRNEMIEQDNYSNVLQISAAQAADADLVYYYNKNEEPEKAIALYRKRIQEGVYSPAVGQRLINEVRERADKQAKLNDVRLARAEINLVKGDPDKVPGILKKYNIDEVTGVLLEERGASLWDKAKLEQKEAQVNSVYSTMKENFGSDYPLMLKSLRNPEFQKTQGIEDTKVINAIESRLHSEMNLAEEEKNLRYKSNASSLFVNLGKTSTAQIKNMVDKDQISWQMGEHFINEKINPPQAPTNPKTFLALLRRADSATTPEDRLKVEAEILGAGDVSRSDKVTLGVRLFREEDKENDVWLKMGEKYLRDMIVPQRGLEAQFRTTFKEEKDNYDALQSFRAALDNAKKAGKPLTGPEIFEEAKRIAPPFMKSLPERMTEYAEEMKKVGVEMKNRTEIMKRAEKYKTKEDVIAAYNNGNGKISYEEAAAILRVKFNVK